jgi:hypothetical protein
MVLQVMRWHLQKKNSDLLTTPPWTHFCWKRVTSGDILGTSIDICLGRDKIINDTSSAKWIPIPAQSSSAQRKVWFSGYGIFGIEGWPNQVGVQVELTWWVLGSNSSEAPKEYPYIKKLCTYLYLWFLNGFHYCLVDKNVLFFSPGSFFKVEKDVQTTFFQNLREKTG